MEEQHLKGISNAWVDDQGQEIVEVDAHRKGIVEELENAHIYISQLEEILEPQSKVFEGRLAKLEALLNTKAITISFVF